MEYFNSTHGARKGLADTALKTANSGYLTRRLVDVANDCIITTEDCGTKHGVTVQAEIDGGQVVSSLAERILGRTAAEDVKHPETGEVIVSRGREISEDLAEKIENAHIQKVRVRSVLSCELTDGVCGKCYGRDLARGTPRQYRRSGRRHCRTVDRRAGHAAHHAHVPYRRRGAGSGPVEDRGEL